MRQRRGRCEKSQPANMKASKTARVRETFKLNQVKEGAWGGVLGTHMTTTCQKSTSEKLF